LAYSTERRAAVLKKLEPPNAVALRQLAKDEGISEATLHIWRRDARSRGRLLPDADAGPEGWTSRDKFAAVLETADEKLRACGLSGSKTVALKDLAAKTLDGTVPSRRELVRMTDEEIVERLTKVRGIGRWTVEMLLLFELGRLDVWPVADYGVLKGFAKTFGKRKLPKPKQFAKIGDKWRPYRSVAAWYFWRALDEPVKKSRFD